VVLCPDVVPFVDHRFDCRNLLQRSVIHYGTAKASAVTCAPRVGQSLRRHAAAFKALHNLARWWWLYTLLTCWIQIEHQYEA
jgi:hypothetical protein